MRIDNLSSGRLTGIRREVKYLIDAKSGAEALSRLLAHVQPKLTDGQPSSFRISIYLDTADRIFSRAELENDQLSTKIRVRDYYLLAEDNSPVFGPSCFLEVKIRLGQMVEKSRFTVAREDVPSTLKKGPEPSSDPGVRSMQEAFEVTRQGKSLEPLFIAHYRRYTLQDGTRFRITVDDMLTYHVARKNMLDASKCARRDLSPPLLVEPGWVVEVKSLGAAPMWVDEILDVNKLSSYSKFGTGVRELERRGMLFPVP